MYSIKFKCKCNFLIKVYPIPFGNPKSCEKNGMTITFETPIGTAYVLDDGCLSIVTQKNNVFIFDDYKINGIFTDRTIGKRRIEEILTKGESGIEVGNGLLSFGKFLRNTKEVFDYFSEAVFKSVEIL